jgi:hypothetical protein
MVHRLNAASAIHASLKQREMSMQALSATAVAAVILYFADKEVYDGQYTAVLTGLLRHVGWLVGVHV